MNVGDAVEEQQHRNGGNQVGRGVEAQRHRHGHTAHRADLQIDDGQVVGPTVTGDRSDLLADPATVGAHGERRVGAPEGRDDVVDEPVDIHRQQHTHASAM